MERTKGETIPAPLAREAELQSELHGVLWVFQDWQDATRGRNYTAEGPQRLNHEGIRCWRENRRIEVSDWEMTVLLEMDEAYLRELTTPLEGKEPRDER